MGNTILEIDTAALEALVGAPGELPEEMVSELRLMWRDFKEDLARNLPPAEGLARQELTARLHQHRGTVESWGMAGLARAMLRAEKSEDPPRAWREIHPEIQKALPEILNAIEKLQPTLKSN